MIYHGLSKKLDKRIGARITRLFQKRCKIDKRITDKLFKEDGITQKTLLDEIHDMFNRTVIDACRFHKIKFNDTNLDAFVNEASHRFRSGDPTPSLIDSQIDNIITFVIQNYIWKSFPAIAADLKLNKREDAIEYIDKIKWWKLNWNKIAKQALDTQLKDLTEEQYYLQKQINKRLIDFKNSHELVNR